MMRPLIRLGIVVFAVALGTVLWTTAAEAHGTHKAPVSDEYNSRIIDDPIYGNPHAMNAAMIQSFLESKEPGVCTGPCLKNYVLPETGERFSVFLDRIAKQWGINPQVTLATLQKEQSLVTSTAATASQLNFAMGYGCPESSPGCSGELSGFYNQVYYGTKYLRAAQLYSCGNRTSMPGYGISTQWNIGNTVAVDGKPTRIGTCATGALMAYTPHRPDSAWLAATNGSHYYGNYNFIHFFQSWFGSTWGASYRAQFAGQSGPPTVDPGGQAEVWFDFKNVGTTTWSQDLVKLGTDRPRDRASGFAQAGLGLGAGWLSNTRVRMEQASVAPGQTARFKFTVTGNPAPGTYHEYYRPVAEGIAWMDDLGTFLPMTVRTPSYGAALVDMNVPPEFPPNEARTVIVRMRNTGNLDWERGGATPVRLGTQEPRDRASPFYNAATWLSPTRIALQEPIVAPGQIGTFRFDVTTPRSNLYTEPFKVVVEGREWLEPLVRVQINSVGTYAAQWAGQSDYPTLAPGQTAPAWVSFKNTGTATWEKTGRFPVRLGTDNPRDRASAVTYNWLSPTRIQMDEDAVAPGETATFSFTVRPPGGGLYREYFRPVAETLTWMGNPNEVFLDVKANLTYSAQWAGQSYPLALPVGTPQTAWISFKNTGTATWNKTGPAPIRLGTDRPRDRNSGFAHQWLLPSRIQMDQDAVAPGQTARFTFSLLPQVTFGTYNEYFRPVAESVQWLEDYGVFFPLSVTGG